RAGPYRVEVRGTRFEIRREGDALAVSCQEGSVAILRAEALLGLLEGPATWSSAEALRAPALELASPIRGLRMEELEWPTLRLPALARIETWEIDGSRFAAGAGLELRVPAGEILVLGWDREGRAHQATLTILDEGSSLSEVDLRPRAASPPPNGILPREAIVAVVAQGRRALSRCFQRALKRRPDLRGGVSLRVTIGRSGQVRRVQVRADEGGRHAALDACIQAQVERWTFPPPEGGPMSFDLPLNLHADP
ncbi:MAG: AgmX/PglI C-terminal domain-containing protein, partial [Myxococcales bacterium]|nr:AgmX/PglI C-terminal domain-containing protein [Myxococcales bacterium]